jgi:hypothetical protein
VVDVVITWCSPGGAAGLKLSPANASAVSVDAAIEPIPGLARAQSKSLRSGGRRLCGTRRSLGPAHLGDFLPGDEPCCVSENVASKSVGFAGVDQIRRTEIFR